MAADDTVPKGTDQPNILAALSAGFLHGLNMNGQQPGMQGGGQGGGMPANVRMDGARFQGGAKGMSANWNGTGPPDTQNGLDAALSTANSVLAPSMAAPPSDGAAQATQLPANILAAFNGPGDSNYVSATTALASGLRSGYGTGEGGTPPSSQTPTSQSAGGGGGGAGGESNASIQQQMAQASQLMSAQQQQQHQQTQQQQAHVQNTLLQFQQQQLLLQQMQQRQQLFQREFEQLQTLQQALSNQPNAMPAGGMRGGNAPPTSGGPGLSPKPISPTSQGGGNGSELGGGNLELEQQLMMMQMQEQGNADPAAPPMQQFM